MTYAEKLKDPRWQKLRLEVLSRDNFTCRACNDKESTLHVHHFKYFKGDPWNTPADYLITFCEPCHKVMEDLKSEVADSMRNLEVAQTFKMLVQLSKDEAQFQAVYTLLGMMAYRPGIAPVITALAKCIAAECDRSWKWALQSRDGSQPSK